MVWESTCTKSMSEASPEAGTVHLVCLLIHLACSSGRASKPRGPQYKMVTHLSVGLCAIYSSLGLQPRYCNSRIDLLLDIIHIFTQTELKSSYPIAHTHTLRQAAAHRSVPRSALCQRQLQWIKRSREGYRRREGDRRRERGSLAVSSAATGAVSMVTHAPFESSVEAISTALAHQHWTN